MKLHRFLLCSLAVGLSASVASATLSKSDKKAKKAKKEKKAVEETSGPDSASVFDLGLVSETVTAGAVLSRHAAYSERTGDRRFRGNVLGYVTPWNGHGYDVAKTFAPKINLVSPVWLQLLPKSQSPQRKFAIGGTHDVDAGWVTDVRDKSGPSQSKVLPRVLFERFTGQDYVSLFRSETERSEAAEAIAGVVAEHGFDGVVLELWSQLGGQAREEISLVIADIARRLHADQKLVVLAIPPPFHTPEPSEGGLFSKADFDRLRVHVDFFSLMTYDFSNVQNPGPNAPLPWMRSCVETLDPRAVARDQILLGLNLYGLKHTSEGGGHVLGRDLVELLKKLPSDTALKWDPHSREHFLQAKESLRQRIALAEELGTGISMWEIGQGMDYFYDLF